MGLLMGMFLHYRSVWQRFEADESPHLQQASTMMQAAWEAYRVRKAGMLFEEYRGTVRVLDCEIQELRTKVSELEHQLAVVAAERQAATRLRLLPHRCSGRL